MFLGADSLCSRLTEKITSNHGQRLVLAHMPLLMVCLEGLGKLAEKFPNIASTSIYYLRDFLVTPSPILLKLHKHNTEGKNTNARYNLLITGKKIEVLFLFLFSFNAIDIIFCSFFF